MLLNNEQLEAVKKACESVDYGSVTIKMNRESKFLDIVIEKQIRMQKESTVPTFKQVDKKYKPAD